MAIKFACYQLLTAHLQFSMVNCPMVSSIGLGNRAGLSECLCGDIMVHISPGFDSHTLMSNLRLSLAVHYSVGSGTALGQFRAKNKCVSFLKAFFFTCPARDQVKRCV